MSVADVDFAGCYDIVYSPDDEASCGKGYWVKLLWNSGKESPLFRNRASADNWARKNGGTRCLRG